MKNLVIFACVIVAANALSKEFVQNFMNKMQEIGSQCMGETGASDDDIAQLIAHKVPDSHEGKCMIYCFHKTFGVQGADGAPNLEGAIKSLDPVKADDAELHGKIKTIFETCIPKTASDADPCITAANLATCATNEGTAMGLSPDMFEI